MSDKTPYEIIKEFCSKSEHKNNKLIEKILIHSFYQEYDEMISQEKQKRSDLSEQEIVGFKNSLLSGINLKKNEEIAIAEIDARLNEKIKWLKLGYRVKNGFSVIFLNVISSIIFTVLLIIVFALAESQIKPLVNDYLAQPKVIESQSDGGG